MKKIFTLLALLFFATNIFAQSDPDAGQKEYFEKNYRTTWDKLSELEQYAIAFSSNLFQLNKYYHLDFSAKSLSKKEKNNLVELLKEQWGITDYDSLIETFDNLIKDGHSGAYKHFSELLDKYKGMSVLDIALEESLSVTDISRLYFVRDSRVFLGSHDIEAWDLGRAITLMRWSIALGYISEEEALSRCAPVVETIKKDYVGWYDYICHYVQGRGFYGVYDCDSYDLMLNATVADSTAHFYIPFDSLTFTGENADKQHAFKDYTFAVSDKPDSKAWEKVQKLYSGEQTKETLEELCKLEQDEFVEYSTLFFDWHVELLESYGSKKDVASYITDMYDYLISLPETSDVYVVVMYCYLSALNAIFEPKVVLYLMQTLPETLQFNTYFYYQYAYACYQMQTICETQEELEEYREYARKAMELLQENDFSIGENMESWLKTFER